MREGSQLEARNEQLEQQAHTLSQMNEALEERVNALLQALQVGGRDAGGGGGGSCTGSGGGGGGTDVTGSVRGDGGGRGTSGGHGGGDDDMEQVVESLREELACETLRRRESEAVARAATAQATAAEQLLLLHGSPHKGPVLRAASPRPYARPRQHSSRESRQRGAVRTRSHRRQEWTRTAAAQVAVVAMGCMSAA